MKSRVLLSLLLLVCLAARGRADDDADRRKLEEAIKARLAEHARKQATNSMLEDTPAPAAGKTDPNAKASAAATTTTTTTADATKPKDEPVTMMPKFEVKREKITELQIQIQEKDKEIAREKKKLKSTDLDQTLNDPKVANKLAIFGGKSTEVTESLASQRVTLLEAERDTLEAMTQARTQAEKDDLQKQLEELAIMRRDLDRPPADQQVGMERR